MERCCYFEIGIDLNLNVFFREASGLPPNCFSYVPDKDNLQNLLVSFSFNVSGKVCGCGGFLSVVNIFQSSKSARWIMWCATYVFLGKTTTIFDEYHICSRTISTFSTMGFAVVEYSYSRP
ncbi:hypothetical protein AKJ16_DCAP11570 [Drosera capensis]